MQAVIPALHFVWTGVSDALAAVLPPNTVAAGVHVSDEILAGAAAVHGLVDSIHQLEFPTFALDRRPVFAAAEPLLL